MVSRRCTPAYTHPLIDNSCDAVAADAEERALDPAVCAAELEDANKLPVVIVPGSVRQNIEAASANCASSLAALIAIAAASEAGDCKSSDVL